MSAIDVDALLQPLSADSPSGPNLDGEPAFFELDKASKGKPERYASDNKVIPAEEPNWREVKDRALAILGRSRDLRAGVLLGRALLKTDSWEGFRDGLLLIDGMVSQLWDSVHPQLDADDGNDPTMRVNVLSSLADSETVQREIRETPLVEDRQLGRFSLRDILIASGRLTPSAAAADKSLPTTADIDAAFMAADLEALKSRHAALTASLTTSKSLENTLTDKVGASRAISFAPFNDVLAAAIQPLTEVLNRRGETVSGAGTETKDADGQKVAASGEITSREDAIRMLDKISDYFKRQEPSSPVPILLERAKGLVSKSFVEIIQDLAPDGVGQVNVIRGVKEG